MKANNKKEHDSQGEPTNRQRAKWAATALDAFLKATGEGDIHDEEAFRDLIADLLHYAKQIEAQDQPGFPRTDPEKIVREALDNFRHEQP
jgi:hypothetical protein